MILELIWKGSPLRSLKHFDTYNMHSLKRMGYAKIDNLWFKKDEERKEEEGRERTNFATEPLEHQAVTFSTQPAQMKPYAPPLV